MALKIGDKIRILKGGLEDAYVSAGDILEIVDIHEDGTIACDPNDYWFSIENLGTGFELLGGESSLDKHYDFFYDLTPFEGQYLQIKLDPYKVSSVWKLGEKDNTGCIFHILKTIARFGQKNDKEREIRAIHATIKRLAEIEGINLDE